MEKGKKKLRWPQKLFRFFLCLIVFMVVAGLIGYGLSVYRRNADSARVYVYTDERRIVDDIFDQGVGRVELRTLPVPQEIAKLDSASYTASGRVIISWRSGGKQYYATLNDDGTDLIELYCGDDKRSSRLLPYPDNTRVLMGDVVLEVPDGYTLDNCPKDSAVIVPIRFPDSIVKVKNVQQAWSEVIISNDNDHIAWTTLRTDCGAVAAIGKMVRYENEYVIEDGHYISAMTGYSEDPVRPGELLYSPVLGGEVKQFVHGGTAVCFVGAGENGMADSVAIDLASGRLERITQNPGYDETTIISPSEEYGVTMTTRFSPQTDLAVLGLVPRPYGDVNMSIMGQIYMYGITGVRGGREGNIGPALINLARSKNEEDYMGINLSDPEGIWIYCSPMSWNENSTSCMWIEQERGGSGIRIRIATLLDSEPAEKVPAVETPAVGDWADKEVKVGNVNGRVMGKVSGYMEIKKTTSLLLHNSDVTVTYVNYSDDGEVFYNGFESAQGGMMTRTAYQAQLSVTDSSGAEIGVMNVKLSFSAAIGLKNLFGGAITPDLDIAASSGSAWYFDRTASTDSLVK